jgi:nucleotide-binding universal stress UspA family protein
VYKKILVPTDGSDLSEKGVDAAIEFARLCGAEIIAFAVAEPAPMPAGEAAMVIDLGVETDRLNQLAQEIVNKVEQTAKAAGVPCKTATAYSAEPAQEIMDAATANQCDLIFMSSHGRHGLSRLLAGSVAQNVLAYSTTPVMLLRPQRHDHD